MDLKGVSCDAMRDLAVLGLGTYSEHESLKWKVEVLFHHKCARWNWMCAWRSSRPGRVCWMQHQRWHRQGQRVQGTGQTRVKQKSKVIEPTLMKNKGDGTLWGTTLPSLLQIQWHAHQWALVEVATCEWHSGRWDGLEAAEVTLPCSAAWGVDIGGWEEAAFAAVVWL